MRGWLALAPVAFGYRSADGAAAPLHRAAWADWATAAALALVSLVTLACWVVTWRRRQRADGIVNRLALAGFAGFFTALAGRVRELYAQAGTAQEPDGGPE